jgi:hypothetical protein
MTTTATMSSYCYRLYAGNGNWITLSTKTTQDLLEIFEQGVSCRYPLSDQLFIDIIPHDVDCNSKNIDMLGLMRADLVYEPLESGPEVQQNMSLYVHSLLNEQGIIDAFPPLRSDGELPSIDSLPTHRHLSLVPSSVNSTKRRVRQPEGMKPTTSLSSSASESPTLEPIQPLPPLATSSFGFNMKKESGPSCHSSSSTSSTASPCKHDKKYHQRPNKKKKYPESSHLETEPLYEDQVDSLEWLSSSGPSSLWIPPAPHFREGFYNEAKMEHEPISPADIMHHYHLATKGPMINMTPPFEMMERNELQESDSSSWKKQWKDRPEDLLEYPFNGEKSRANILSHQ